MRLLGTGLFGSLPLWRSYLDVAYPGVKPADWTERLARIETRLREPGRMKAMQAMGRSAPTERRRPARRRALPGPGGDGHARPRLGPTRTPRGSAVVDALPSGLGAPGDDRGRLPLPDDQFPDPVGDAPARLPA